MYGKISCGTLSLAWPQRTSLSLVLAMKQSKECNEGFQELASRADLHLWCQTYRILCSLLQQMLWPLRVTAG
jgi:hypothetical protein